MPGVLNFMGLQGVLKKTKGGGKQYKAVFKTKETIVICGIFTHTHTHKIWHIKRPLEIIFAKNRIRKHKSACNPK